MKVIFTERSLKDWRQLDKFIQNDIRDKLNFYVNQNNPFQFAEKLKNYKYGDYRFRVGNYRIIFDVDGDKIIVLRIGYRKDIYK